MHKRNAHNAYKASIFNSGGEFSLGQGEDMQVLEVWRKIEGFPHYSVSNMGRIRRIGKLGSRGKVYVEKHLKPCRSSSGYLTVNLYKGKKTLHSSQCVHVLVLRAFKGTRPSGMVCNHVDGNKRNNHASNLEWITLKGNAEHAMEMGLVCKGERHGKARLKEKDIRNIRALVKKGKTPTQISRLFSISRPHVHDILNGKVWKHV